ncbi:P-loop containing nucleoside triphosphate hydrolase protein [Pholiota molesta]|nr:P-loop containing nucleoside triphosphate hydrolase protein [Pholiota molesta]
MSSMHIDAKDSEHTNSTSEAVSLLDLFRFSSKFEIFLNFLGLISAIICGGATPFMSILFGNLISSFVVIGQAHSEHNNATESDLQAVATNFLYHARLDALKLLYLGLGTFTAAFLCISLWSFTSEAISNRLRERYFRAVATRLEIDVHLVQQGISEKFAFIASYSSSFVTGISIAYTKSWRLALALSSILPCIILVGTGIAVLGARYSKDSVDSLSKAGGIAQETLSTIRTIHALGAERKMQNVFANFIDQARRFDIKFSRVLGIGMAVFSFIVYSSYALSFYFGTTLLLQGHGDAGTVVTVGLAILIGSFSCLIVGPNIEAVMHAREAAYRLYKVIDRVPLIDSDSSAGEHLGNIRGDITFKDVVFKYPSRPDVQVIDQLSLTFPTCKTTALVGLSGSGKSTILSLIERFYDIDAGEILLDGVDLHKINIKSLRSHIGYVAQEPVLFAASIRENIALGLVGSKYEGASAEEKFDLVKQASTKAQAHDFITMLPLGYDTLVGNDGMRLSGGQRQRIAIARAIVSDPRILLLDEATSALDTESEAIVQAALTKASQGRTTIIIAHRLSTVKDADIIYVMGHGCLLEQGTHYELSNNPRSHYAHLVNAQQLDQRIYLSDDTKDEDIIQPDEDLYPSDIQDVKEAFVASDLREQTERAVVPIGTFNLIREVGKLVPDTFHMYSWGTLFGLLGGLVYPAHGIVYARALHAFENSDRHILRTAGSQNALFLFVIALVATICLGFHNVLFGKAAMILVARLRLLSFQALLKRNVTFFDRDENNPGTLTANLVGGPEKIKGFTSTTLGAIVQCLSCCIGGSVVSLIFGWKLGLVGIACMPPIVGAGFLRLQLVAEKERTSKEAHGQSAQIASEAVVAIRTVASLTCEDQMSMVYHRQLYRKLSWGEIMSNAASNAVFAFSLSAIFFAVSLVFWYGSHLVASGEYTTFRFYVSFMTTVFGSWNAANVFLSVPDISSATEAARDIVTHLRYANPSHDKPFSPPRQHWAVLKGSISLRNVTFRYPCRPEALVLDNISVDIPEGAHVAFVGPSGSGKSTIIQLIERFYELSSGSIYVDGESITNIERDHYLSHIAFVSQDPRLYSGSIKFNILLGSIQSSENVTEDQIREACRVANILDFIESLPMGFETQVGERGSQLSGGQKQRIAIARALIRNPKILLLDEATSALDANSEIAVQKALSNAAAGRTTIAIAHRLSTIQHADCIYFIQGGRIWESGTHNQLLTRRGKYYAYAQLQQL